MTALLAPARFPLTTIVDEGLEYCDDDDQQQQQRDTHSIGGIHLRHDYLQSLISERRWGGGSVKTTERKQRVFCVSLPETIVAPGSRREYRSLSEPFVQSRRMAAVVPVVEENAVVATEETAPSSPPELSYSKSSKSSSSSVRSDSLSDDERGGSTEKLAHLEDVSFDDGGRDSIDDSNLRPESRPTLKRPSPRSSTASDSGKKGLSSPLPLRENRYPSLRGAVSGVLRDQSLNLPSGGSIRRGFTNPSAPSLMMHAPQRIPSRSPSPDKPFMQNGFSASPQALASATPRLSADSVNGPLARRKSWQPGRKSVKELEEEYNDEDEDVPDEAVLENVPISPMPGQSRPSPSRSPTPSPHRSPHRSPNRRPSHPSIPSAPSHTSLHSAKVPKNAKRPSAPTVLPNGQYGLPRSPRHSMRPPLLQHSATMPAFPMDPSSRKQRSKSWTEDLSEEARQLSAALDEYADRLSMEKHGPGSGANSVSSSPPRPSVSKQRAKSSILELPPKQKGSIMIDPLPISKEKEAVLTRTRPSWLPPKNQKEERRHIREWEQMMARAAENEKKRQLREQEALENKEELEESVTRMWDQHVLPNWDEQMKDPRTRELWWRGVTPRSRGPVWQKAIGNELGLSESSFDAALRRATALEEKIADMPSEERSKSKEAAWLNAIARDVPTACPDLPALREDQSFQSALSDVLKAYALYRADVGYVYGTHFIAGILCLHMRPCDAFVTLANMLNRPIPLAFLVHDTAAMSRAYELVLSTLKYKRTKLHDHLTSPAVGLKPEEYLEPIFRCLFAYNLPTEHVSRVWDIFAFEGDKALVRAAVAVLGRLEGKLYSGREEVMDVMSWRNEAKWDVGSDGEFVKAVREAGKVDGKGEV